MSNSFEHFEKRFFSLLGRLRRHKGWMSETTQLASEINPTERVGKPYLFCRRQPWDGRSQSHRKEWSSTTNACGGIRDG